MTKTTTADCKRFLVDTVKQKPIIINSIWRDQTTAMQEAVREKLWKREAKFRPTSTHDYALDEYRLWDWGDIVPTEDINWVRIFCLDPDQFEDAVKFFVYEMKNGDLVLGDYIGD